MSLPCLILAAGFGTRMGALTVDTPKPLIKVAGRTLLDHALQAAAPCSPVAVNAHYRADKIAAHLSERDVEILREEPEILDSGGSVKNAARHWPQGPMATLNADNVWTGLGPIAQLRAAFDPETMGALLLLLPLASAIGRQDGGDFSMDADGRLTLDKTHGTFVHTGAQILDPGPCLAEERDIFSLRDIWDGLEREGRLFGLIHQGNWADVGHPEGITAAEEMARGADV
jgi:MurNAc alpha-1-phosphate uridylyltransferase